MSLSNNNKTITSYYSRTNISEDYPLTAFLLSGPLRLMYLSIYCVLVASAILGILTALYLDPLFCVLGLTLCYISDNVLFAILHLRLHALFIELPEKNMSVIEHHSFIHHYRNIKIFHETWLETRIAYFIDPRHFKSGLAMFLYKIVLNVLTSLILYAINPIIGITYFSGILGINLLQATLHEWYHNPPKNRKNFYSPFIFLFLSFLEKIKIASSKKHLKHHFHNLSSLDKANVWLDLYFPKGEVLANKVWGALLTKYVPGKTYMTALMTRVYEYTLVTMQIILPVLFVAIFYGLHGL